MAMSQEFVDELEALQSVYSDLLLRYPPTCSCDSNMSNGTSEISDDDSQTIVSLSCVPRSNSTSFVLTEIELTVPLLYPDVKPSFKIVKSVGLSDEGREIKDLVNKFIFDAPTGECLLFQVVCLVYDYLDDCNIGECYICADELKNFDYSGKTLKKESSINDFENKLYGVKTPCCHCFHMTCLSKWAAIKIVQNDNNKKGDCWIKDKDLNIIKCAEGGVKTEENEIKILLHQKQILLDLINEKEISLLKNTIVISNTNETNSNLKEKEKEKEKNFKNKNKNKNGTQQENKINSNFTNSNLTKQSSCTIQNNSEVIIQNLKVSIRETRTKLSDVVILIQKNKFHAEKNKLNEEASILRKKLFDDELLLESIERKTDTREISKECSAMKEEEIILERSRESLTSVEMKLLRANKKLNECLSELSYLRVNLAQKIQEKNDNYTFPCAYCRTELTSSSCFVSCDKNEKILFDLFLEVAVCKERREVENIEKG